MIGRGEKFMAKGVIDANVIISAAFGGIPLEAVIRVFKDHEVYLSAPVIRELENVFQKLSQKVVEEKIIFLQHMIHRLIALAQCIPVSVKVILSRDAKDDHYLSLCKEAKADFLITGDKDLLNLSPKALRENRLSTRIVNPNLFLELNI